MEDSGKVESSDDSTSEDLDLKMLNARRMLEIRKRMNSEAAKKSLEKQQQEAVGRAPTDREILLNSLTDRGDEVLKVAEASYPKEMRILIPRMAQLIKEGKVTSITGGELLQFFRSLGMRVSVSTSISVQEHGKFVSLAEKLKRDEP
jgi:DNA-binding TFAR19-related protein (PDSD5 family)